MGTRTHRWSAPIVRLGRFARDNLRIVVVVEEIIRVEPALATDKSPNAVQFERNGIPHA
jgi:hypothetical protein